MKTIGILTAGGDCPGLNAVIRAVVKTAIHEHGIEVIGFRDGYDGLIHDNFIHLGSREVSGILTIGGTILGTSNVAYPYHYAIKRDGKVIYRNCLNKVKSNYRRHKLDGLIVVGGDGTLTVASQLIKDGLNIVGVPKTIDNDLCGTDLTFGYDSAITTATEAIDKLHSTAQSHHRVMVVEVMGRYAGWIALASGMASGGDVILIPEIPYSMDKICEKLNQRRRSGKRFSIIVVAEGAKAKGGQLTVRKIIETSPDKIRLGGIAYKLADEIEKLMGLESRATILGHIQRGGTPTAFDRILATRYGAFALELVVREKFGRMAALRGNHMESVPIKKAVDRLKLVKRDCPMIRTMKGMGISFGD